MNLFKILPIVILLLVALLLPMTIPSVLACDPDKGDWTNCPPTPTVVRPATVVGSTTITSTARMNVASMPIDSTLPLACLLPVGDAVSNALGISNLCSVVPVQVRVVKAVPTPAPTVKAVAVAPPLPKGDSPATARPINGDLHTLDAGGVAWYKIDNGNNFFLDVWLDASGRGGITFAVFAPEQINGLSVDTQPKGRGAAAKNDPRDLIWKGSYAMGVWHVLVRNHNPAPVQFKLGTMQSTTDRKCVSYWEWLPTGAYVLWTDCGMYTDTSKLP